MRDHIGGAYFKFIVINSVLMLLDFSVQKKMCGLINSAIFRKRLELSITNCGKTYVYAQFKPLMC